MTRAELADEIAGYAIEVAEGAPHSIVWMPPNVGEWFQARSYRASLLYSAIDYARSFLAARQQAPR